jgi:acetyl esterase/lipase
MIQTLKFKSIYFSTLLFLVFSSCIKEPVNPNNNNGTSNLTDTTMLNVSYGSHIRQVYDIYLPKNRDTNTPVILMIHGGAWKAGQKEDFNYYRDLIKAKWNSVAIVNMNYRLASNTNNIHHNEILADISSVVNSINSNQANYQISKKIGVIGASAGGQLAMIYAYKYNNNIKCVGNIFGPSIINDWSWYNSTNIWLGVQMKDVLTEYVGQTWDTTAYKAVSPYWNINSNSQPTIMFHGNLDPIVPVYQSQWMNGKLNSFGVANQYHEYIAFHSFDNTQSDDVINKLVTFFKAHIN